MAHSPVREAERQHERHELRKELSDSDITVVVGLGGVGLGLTRLARFKHRCRDAVCKTLVGHAPLSKDAIDKGSQVRGESHAILKTLVEVGRPRPPPVLTMKAVRAGGPARTQTGFE